MDFTLAIYCHNNEDSIKECLQSVFQQTIKPTIIYIIDDASTDKTWEKICEALGYPEGLDRIEFQTIINGVRVTVQQNEFEDGSFTTFVNTPKLTDWTAFLRGDQEILAEKLNSIEEYADENFAYLYGDFIDVDGIRAYLTSHWTDRPTFGFFNRSSLEKINLNTVVDFAELNKIIRTNFLVGHIPEALSKCLIANAMAPS